jgi:Transglycosylase SLT domain
MIPFPPASPRGQAAPASPGRPLRALDRKLALAIASAAAILALIVPGQAGASEPPTTTTTATPVAGETAPSPAPAPATTTTTPTAGAPATPAPAQPTTTPAPAPSPEASVQEVQTVTPSAPAPKHGASGATGSGGAGGATGEDHPSTTGAAAEGATPAGHSAPAPSTFKTPGLPFALGATIGGVPAFFIESFQVPPFLLPIYQAAGTAYGIPWQVLAAINEVETDYGRDLSVSSAGAEGWMQFLPSTWLQYGVDANGAGYEDPYNPADAIFAAAHYLRAAGGDRNIKAAIYAYNHSQAYVDSVMLRAQLLGGTPPELLGAITGLTESEFPVHAASHFSDGFQTIPAKAVGTAAKTLAGTTIYSQVNAPVIAVQDGEVAQIGESPSLGHFVALRDAYGNTYVYAELGDVASVYPVLEPHEHTAVSARIARASSSASASEPLPSGPATAGAQPRSPLSTGATVSGLALGAAADLEAAPTTATAAPTTPVQPTHPPPPASPGAREFRAGPDDVYLHPLRVGVQVLAGTVLGHVGAATGGQAQAAGPGTAGGGASEPHIFFQIKPAGADAPLIDPKPILDGWVALEDTSIFRAKGENPFLATSPTVGQVLLESKAQLQQQVAHDHSIRMRACERQGAQTGRVSRPVLALLEYLSVSGLKPTVQGLKCAGRTPASEGNSATSANGSVEITAINGIPIAGHQGPGSIADVTIRKLLMLEGLNRPRRIVSLTGVPDAANVYVKQSASDYIYVSFAAPAGAAARAAQASGSGLSPSEWVKLIARLGEIPDPTVSSGPSSAAIPDRAGAPTTAGGTTGQPGVGASPDREGGSGGNG